MTLSNVTRRGRIGGLAAGVSAAAVISSGTFISGARAQSARKTFILVPGAFCGAWCWRSVSDRLEKQGHKVYPLSLTGLGDHSHLLSKDINLDTHITDIANLGNGKTSPTFALLHGPTVAFRHPARSNASETVSRPSSGLMH
jgi:hypothetical protein